MPRGDVVTLVEAIYALEDDADAWLRSIAAAARFAFRGQNVGAYAIAYDASDIFDCRFHAFVPSGIKKASVGRLLREDAPAAYRSHPASVESVFRRTPYGTIRSLPLGGAVAGVRARLLELGVDIVGLNGVNPDGRGAHVGVVVPVRHRPVHPELLARLSSHLAAGFRLRARLGKPSMDSADAILRPGGTVEHAVGAARLREAREDLVQAAVRVDRLRSSVRKRDPERAVADWKALVDARWSLVDFFERGGRRYILAHRNDAAVWPVAILSQRERQVVALAALGHANKMIGYELGISVSTAGVLLSRAARKLGVRSRGALIAAYHARATDSPRP